MKKTLLITLALLALTSLLLCSCGEKPEMSDGYYLTAEISAEKQAAVDEVLSTFMLCYEEDKPEEAMNLLSESFMATEEEMSAFFDGMRLTCENPFVPFESYYMTNLPAVTDGVPLKVKNKAEDENYIEIVPSTKNHYLAIYVADGKKIANTMSILLEENGGKFEISWISPGELSYGGKDAHALYELTKKLEDESKLFPAYIYSCMLGNTIRPGTYYHYGNETEMDDICYRLISSISEKYKLPYALSGTNNSSLYVVGITNNADYGVIPLLLVKTDVDVKNSSALRTEARKVVSSVDSLSGKLSESFDVVELHMTNEDPATVEGDVPYEAVVLKLN